ncbi:MAG: alkaline phosphatase [Thermomonas sp.]|uniref:alkaline phosphatase n=1 Tax=Thermomonas sp. TaxID=1971895 RepID=UPI00260EA82E|nr:alkaline phosphatase [Thermomonas sp.]MCC7095723.1 alkaline phosphatase [Thermomonas sp.]
MTPARTITAFAAATLITGLFTACASNPSNPTPTAALPQGAGVDLASIRHPDEESPAGWYRAGAAQAAARGAMSGRARNVIVFIGDGMSMTTVTAARIMEGQRAGGRGEENRLAWDHFPATALSRTYNTDAQTPDSAGTMSAIATGVKTHMGAISVYAGNTTDCADSMGKHAQTWLELADAAGMSTGVVTTSRVTHATPAATYAHTPNRRWENDATIPEAARAQGCRDIASQLIAATGNGHGPSIILGGGRKEFLTTEQTDPSSPDKRGLRTDGRDLITEWRQAHAGGAYVTTAAELASAANAPAVLGLFNYSHMAFNHDRIAEGGIEPSLAEMTRAAIRHLARNENGYVLLVEAARIDMAHHEGNAFRALDETIELSNAVRIALEMTSPDDTLIMVTADHSHTLTMAGYTVRGNPILGTVRAPGKPKPTLDLAGLPFTTLGYANGPGNTGASEIQVAGSKRFPHYPKHQTAAPAGRPDLSQVDTTRPEYMQEALVPLSSETHSGEDVGVWAIGPGSAAVRGSLEQNALYHIIVQATPRLRDTLCAKGWCDGNGVPVTLPRLEAFSSRPTR